MTLHRLLPALVLVATTALGAPAVRASGKAGGQAGTAPPTMKVIRFGKLVDGTGRTLSDAVVVVEGDHVVSVGRGNRTVPRGAALIDLRRYTGVPGLIDLHTHMT